ncbi:hypothetical protein T069G_01387 [Trichoderma breve]|uniref:Uncharacterized protein n=1 Tax=Trichoderma breve TaxID=2034170 RepID=A0A9W9JSV7_9HYPO|nr:hypothetical protein T069G_01387 [Trichoderma breve]KAJ4864857.1 hypothetical protein T069G_01387 [Trichoderma breve]
MDHRRSCMASLGDGHPSMQNVTTTVIAVLAPYKQTERSSYPISLLKAFRGTAPLPARCQHTEVPRTLVTCIRSDIHFIDAALEGGRGTDLQLSYARAPDIVQGTRLTTRAMGFATPNNKEAVSRDDNPQCHLLTPDPTYKGNVLANNSVPMLKMFSQSICVLLSSEQQKILSRRVG